MGHTPAGHRPLNQQCPQCSGEGTVVVPRAGIAADGSTGTVNVAEKCRACDGDGWLAWGTVRTR